MIRKKLVTTLTLTSLAAAAVFVASRFGWPSHDAAQNDNAVINSEIAAGQTRESAPELSTERFELPPSIGTGQYTEPQHRDKQSAPDDKEKD